MQHYIIMCRSLTYAQRASRALERASIFASTTKAPQELTKEGCNYGVKVRARDLDRSLDLIKNIGLPTGRIIGLDEYGRALVVGE